MCSLLSALVERCNMQSPGCAVQRSLLLKRMCLVGQVELQLHLYWLQISMLQGFMYPLFCLKFTLMNTMPPDYEWLSELYGFQPETQCVAQEAVGISQNVAKAVTPMRGDFGFPFHTEGNRTTQSKTEPFVEETVFVLFVSFCHALQKIGRRIHRLIMNYESTICCTLSRRNSTVFVNSGDRWKCMQWMLTTGVASIHSGMCREITQSSLGSNIHWRRSWILSLFLEVSMCANTFDSIFLCINLRVEYSREKWLKTAVFILDTACRNVCWFSQTNLKGRLFTCTAKKYQCNTEKDALLAALHRSHDRLDLSVRAPELWQLMEVLGSVRLQTWTLGYSVRSLLDLCSLVAWLPSFNIRYLCDLCAIYASGF